MDAVNGLFRLVISRHARRRMAERGVGLEDVIEALNNPVQHMYDSWRDVYIAVSIRGVAIVYAYRGSRYEILTVLDDKTYRTITRKYKRRYRLIQ